MYEMEKHTTEVESSREIMDLTMKPLKRSFAL